MNAPRLPLVDGTAVARVDVAPDLDHGEACITCGDVALPLTVVGVAGSDARCRDEASGAEEVVAIDLVAPVLPGDRLLVHARVALEVLGVPATETGRRAAPGPDVVGATRRPSGHRPEGDG